MEEIKSQPKIVYLSLGSNLGDRIIVLKRSLELIAETIGEIFKCSSIYENPPVGFESNDLFCNMCLAVSTVLSPIEILNKTQEIEVLLGRKSKTMHNVFESRVIDIDLILIPDLIINTERLRLPHPEYLKRNFVLIPLNEIASDVIDPVLQLSIHSILIQCLDISKLFIVEKPFLLV